MDKTCEIHNVTMTQREGKFGPFWSHKEGEGWCNGKPKDYKATWENRKKDFLDAVEPTKAPEKAEVDWDSKERRMVRMNVLNRATDLVVADKVDIKQIESVAEKLEDWIYRK